MINREPNVYPMAVVKTAIVNYIVFAHSHSIFATRKLHFGFLSVAIFIAVIANFCLSILAAGLARLFPEVRILSGVNLINLEWLNRPFFQVPSGWRV